MDNKRASRRFTIIIFTLTALMICFAWVHSLFPANLSSQESEGVFKFVNQIFAFFGAGEALTQKLIRKLAHFTEFFAIGGLMLSCGYCFDRRRPWRHLLYVLAAGLAAAVIDETIQLFSEGRAGLIADVWIDFAGVCCGAGLLLGCYALYGKKKGWR